MKVEELCRCLLWCNTLRAGVCFLGKVEQTVKSPKKESHFKAQLPVAELLCNNALVYASFIKAVVLLASLPVTKVQLRETRNQVEHTVSKLLFEADFPDKMDERTGASAAVMNAKGDFWWDGRYASLHHVWEIHHKTTRFLEKARARVPEQTRIQRGPDASDITSFKDSTKVSKKLWLGMIQSSTYANWQDVVGKHCKPRALAEASSLLPGDDGPPSFDSLLTAGRKGNKDLAHCLQWIFIMGALLTFREAYTQEALSEQREHASSGRKIYKEDYLTKEENLVLNKMIYLADGYAHFHKDQVEVDQKDEHLIHVIDTPYTYIDDDMTEEMLKVAAKIREQVHDQLWELS